MASSSADSHTPPAEFKQPLWRSLLRANKQYVVLSAVAAAFSVRILTDKYEHAAEVAALQAKLDETAAELETLKRSVPAASQGTQAAKQQVQKGVTPPKPKGPALI